MVAALGVVGYVEKMVTQNKLYHLSFRISAGKAELLDELLAANEVQMVTWAKDKSRTVFYSQYLPSSAEAVALKQSLVRLIRKIPPGRVPVVKIKAIRQEDWSETWKRYFHVFRCGKHMVVRPTWEEYCSQPGDIVIDMDPGMAFGSGHHGTTRSCLVLMEKVAAGLRSGSVLDVGCGSGILAIAAAKLGCHDVTAIDNDPQAIKVAKENIGINGLSGRIKCHTADLAKLENGRRYDVVVANILAEVIERYADKITRAVKKGGQLIVSGILVPQYPAVKKALVGYGFREKTAIVDGEWKSGLFCWR